MQNQRPDYRLRDGSARMARTKDNVVDALPDGGRLSRPRTVNPDGCRHVSYCEVVNDVLVV